MRVRLLTIGAAGSVLIETEAAAKAAGRLRIEGEEYVVAAGDVMPFQFNV